MSLTSEYLLKFCRKALPVACEKTTYFQSGLCGEVQTPDQPSAGNGLVTRQQNQGVLQEWDIDWLYFCPPFFFFRGNLTREHWAVIITLKTRNKREKSRAALDEERVGFRVLVEAVLGCSPWKQTLRWSIAYRRFLGEHSWDLHLQRSGHRWSWVRSGEIFGWGALQNCPRLNQRLRLYISTSASHWLWAFPSRGRGTWARRFPVGYYVTSFTWCFFPATDTILDHLAHVALLVAYA